MHKTRWAMILEPPNSVEVFRCYLIIFIPFLMPINFLIAYWEKLNHLQIYQLLNIADMGPIAVVEFIKYFKKHHKDVRYRECGIFIDKTKQYLGASPDLLIECSCSGEAVVEIKNPFSIANEIPSPHNLLYLCMCNGRVALRQQHQYFAQVQGEIAITKRPLCYFFVYKQKGYHLETIRFNATYWCRL